MHGTVHAIRLDAATVVAEKSTNPTDRLDVALITDEERSRQELQAELQATGCHVRSALLEDRTGLPAALEQEGEVLVLRFKELGEGQLSALKHAVHTRPRPVVLLGPLRRELLDAGMEAGVSAWVLQDRVGSGWSGVMDLAVARFRRERRLILAAEEAHHRLDERKRVDQAKGAIMQQRGCTEAEAYRAMQKMAMDRKKRMGEIAEDVISVLKLVRPG